jgi:hypothetical protein
VVEINAEIDRHENVAFKVPEGADWHSFDRSSGLRGLLVREHGGEGDPACMFYKCPRRVLCGLNVCVEHAHSEYAWPSAVGSASGSPGGPASIPCVDPMAALAGLIDEWCEKRQLGLLARLLPAYLGINGLTDGWGELRAAVRCDVPDEYRERLRDVERALDRMLDERR